MKIAVIDSGIDYTHTDFGGSGKLEDYEKASKLTELPSADSGLINRTKVAGGYDLVGDAYDGSNTATPDGQPARLHHRRPRHPRGGHRGGLRA